MAHGERGAVSRRNTHHAATGGNAGSGAEAPFIPFEFASFEFKSSINELRLEAVCRELMADPRRTILDTIFANGFNSKSSFNDLFFKKYGMTPKEFRRANLGRPGVGRLKIGRSW